MKMSASNRFISANLMVCFVNFMVTATMPLWIRQSTLSSNEFVSMLIGVDAVIWLAIFFGFAIPRIDKTDRELRPWLYHK